MPSVDKLSSKKNYYGVQALRGIAALMVVVHHAIELWSEKITLKQDYDFKWENGAAGVDIFFVISGFVMMISTPGLAAFSNKGAVFLWRRLTRIIPLYWFFTSLKLVLLKLIPALGQQTAGTSWHIIASYLFIPSLNDRQEPFPLLVVGWTLNYEMLFYLLFAIPLAFNISLLSFLIPALAALALLGYLDQSSWPTFTMLASPIVLEFLFGVLLGRIALYRRLASRRTSILLLVTGTIAIITVPSFGVWRWVCWGIPAAAIVSALVALEDQINDLLPKWLLKAGDASYSIYLAHTFVLPALAILLVRLGTTGTYGFAGTLVLALVLSLIAGEVVHRMIEFPLIVWFKNRGIQGVRMLPH